VALWFAFRSAPPAPPDPDPARLEPTVARRLAEARRAVLDEPRSAARWGRLGMVQDVHGLLPEAAACYREAGRLDPRDFRWPYFLSFCADDPREQAEALERACRLRPEYVPALVRLGLRRLALGETAAARSAFDAALARESGHGHALHGRALVACAEEDWARARELLERAARAHPERGEVHAKLARVYARLGLEEPARQAAARAQAARGDAPLSDPARDELQAEGATADHLVAQALALVQAGSPEPALARLRAALAAQPGHRAGRRLLASLLARRGEAEEADRLFRELEAADPRDPATRFEHGWLLLREKRWAEAVATLEAGAGAEPPHVELLNALAWLRATLPDPALRSGARAVELAERMSRADAAAAAHWRTGTLAAAYAEAGRFKEAARVLRGAIGKAEAAGDAAWVKDAVRRLQLYEQGRTAYEWP
jgi:tetratricopeptide (TPR) repeat protein